MPFPRLSTKKEKKKSYEDLMRLVTCCDPNVSNYLFIFFQHVECVSVVIKPLTLRLIVQAIC